MATVSVGRGATPTQSVYRGRALSRVDAEPTQEERMELGGEQAARDLDLAGSFRD